MKNIENIFENKSRTKATIAKRNYDIRVTLNKNGKNSFAVRFGFINKALSAFKDTVYIQPSSVEKMSDRIYFKAHEERTYFDVYRMSEKKNDTELTSKYFAFTPSEKAEKIYRSKWIGKTFQIKYDQECGLYYIELPESEENETDTNRI